MYAALLDICEWADTRKFVSVWFGEGHSKADGYNPSPLVTAAAVAVSGIIGWVGLLVPHAARLLVGPSFARLLPLAMLIGAGFLLAVDTLCRTVSTIEVPPGVLTALIGTPFFLWLFALSRRAW